MVMATLVFAVLTTCASSMQQRAVKVESSSVVPGNLSEELLKKDFDMTRPLSLAANSLNIPNISLKGKDTFCRTSHLVAEEKVLPQLYLLGSMKAGTSSIAKDLTNLGVRPADGKHKEFHFFGHTYDPLKQSVIDARKQWLSVLPNCPKDGSQMLIADYTPQMHYMPLTEGSRPLLPGPVVNFSLPRILERFYYKAEDKNRLVFVASLREPLSRMQSAWYAGRMCNNHCICTWCTHKTFERSLQQQLLEWRKVPRGVSEWLWASMYGHLLEKWLQFFPAKGFIIQPLGLYSKNGISPLCKAIAIKTGIELQCDHLHQMEAINTRRRIEKAQDAGDTARAARLSHASQSSDEATHVWGTKHPSLEQDAGAQLLKDYAEIFRMDREKLINISVKVHEQGGVLVGYGGKQGDALAVAKWLDENW